MILSMPYETMWNRNCINKQVFDSTKYNSYSTLLSYFKAIGLHVIWSNFQVIRIYNLRKKVFENSLKIQCDQMYFHSSKWRVKGFWFFLRKLVHIYGYMIWLWAEFKVLTFVLPQFESKHCRCVQKSETWSMWPDWLFLEVT